MSKIKCKTGILVLIILMSLAVSAFCVSAAGYPRTVYGKVYIDGELAPDGTTVKLVLESQEITNNTYENGNYVMNFIENNWEEGTFSVYYMGVWYSTTPQTVQLGGEDALHYPVNLSVTLPANNPPNTPNNPNPSNGATNVVTNKVLSWIGGDPDVGDTVSYNVYFGAVNPPTTMVSNNQTGTTYTPSLDYDTSYYWKIISWDNHGWSSEGPIWSFKTKAKTTNGGGGGGSGGYTIPTADANGPYYEFLDKTLGYAEVTFDGSGSTGDITLYSWDFGDDTTGTGVSPIHRYQSTGNFTITLSTSGPAGYSVAQTFALITKEPNIDPTNPIVDGPQYGSANTDYNYTMVSTDADNDSIEYIIDWGDGTTKTTDFYVSGTIVTETHNWPLAGVYTVKVTASDNDTLSGTTSYVVLIDAWWVKHIGYLLDTDGDGTYDSFYSNETSETSDVEKQSDGKYLINSDDDGEWDWIYDKDTDTLTEYTKDGAKDEDNTILYVAAIIIILLLLVLLILAGRKKRKKEELEKKTKKTKKNKKPRKK